MSRFYSIILIAFLFGCMDHQNKEIPVIEGTVINPKSAFLLFCKNDALSSKTIDTISINEEGNFYIYKSSIDTTGFYSLQSSDFNINLFLKPNHFVQLSFDANAPEKTIKSTNSKFHTYLWQIEKYNRQFAHEMNKTDLLFQQQIGKENVDSVVNTLKSQKDSITQLYKKKYIDLLEKTNSPVLDYLILNQKYKNNSVFSLESDLSLFLKNSDELIKDKDLKPLFEDYDKQLLSSYSTIRNIQRHDSGEKLPSLKARTKWNSELNLSQMNAKFVLFVFWNGEDDKINGRLQEIKKTYSKFSRRGLKLLFVAYQKDKDLWNKTISANKLPYWHLIDTLGVQSPDIKDLGVRSLPYTFLVSQDSTIISRGKWGNELDAGLLSFIKKY